jgi:archaellum component FlaC
MTPLPTIRIALCLSAFVLLGGCWLSQKGPEPPDLTKQVSETEERIQRIERIVEIMQRDLDKFERLRREFFETPLDFYNSPFPLDLFKHVAMACLNEPWNPNELDEDAESAAIRSDADVELSCRPAFAGRLDDVLAEEAPDRRARTLQKLERIDTLRRLRGRLRDRIGAIPSIIRAQRNFIADQRAELRQLRASLERRRTEYSSARWNQAQSRVGEQSDTLDELATSVDRLDALWPKWPERVDANVLELYMRLSELSANEESWRN